MLAESGLLQQLQQHAWYGNRAMNIYGDPAYPISIHLQAPFRGARLTDEQKRYNKAMSSVRISVEWLFGLVSNYFKFIDFKKMQRIGMSPIGKIFIVCSIYCNMPIHVYVYVEPPRIHDYFQ